MGKALAQVIFQGATGLSEDVFVNTFHFEYSGAGPISGTEITDIEDNLISFYNDIHSPSTSALATELSTSIIRASSLIKVYDLEDPEPRPPVDIRTWTLGATGGTKPAPNEVALCLSYKADLLPGDNPKTHRGRVYLGPVMLDNWSLSGGDLQPNTSAVGKIVNAGLFLAGVTPPWVVYSPTDDAIYNVTHGFVDNAADTQRRRGRKATVRTTWTE